MATFDGLNKYGYPYNIDGNNNPKPCDTLTSQPIDLVGLSEGDSIYLSFYLQQKGVGENPETNDSFLVEFKKDNNEWLRVWTKNADFDSFSVYPFKPYLVKLSELNDGTFYHDSFQFRFRNYSNRTGALDQWHLDYVSLMKTELKVILFLKMLVFTASQKACLRTITQCLGAITEKIVAFTGMLTLITMFTIRLQHNKVLMFTT